MWFNRLTGFPALLVLAMLPNRSANGDLILGLVTPVEWDVAASPDGILDVMFSVRSNGESNTRDELNSFS